MQLARERAAGRVLPPSAGWREGALAFPPTYKYVKGTTRYTGDAAAPAAFTAPSGGGGGDASEGGVSAAAAGGGAASGETARRPAWTDRVLSRGDAASLLAYSDVPALTSSDHRPVRAVYLVGARRAVPALLDAALREAQKRADAAELARVPRCELHPPGFQPLGDVSFGAPREVRLTLLNTGAVAARWRLGSNDDAPADGGRGDKSSGGGGGGGGEGLPLADSGHLPPWLRVSPTSG